MPRVSRYLHECGRHFATGTQPDGVNAYGVDLPDMQPGALNLNHNPRNGQPYFNTSLFSLPAWEILARPPALVLRAGNGELRHGPFEDPRPGRVSQPTITPKTSTRSTRAVLRTNIVNGEITSASFGKW